MGKRGELNMDAMLASKEVSAVVRAIDPVVDVESADILTDPPRPGKGRPRKVTRVRDPDAALIGQTIRMTNGERDALRKAADLENRRRREALRGQIDPKTGKAAKHVIASVHDVILDAVYRHLSRLGIPIEE